MSESIWVQDEFPEPDGIGQSPEGNLWIAVLIQVARDYWFIRTDTLSIAGKKKIKKWFPYREEVSQFLSSERFVFICQAVGVDSARFRDEVRRRKITINLSKSN